MSGNGQKCAPWPLSLFLSLFLSLSPTPLHRATLMWKTASCVLRVNFRHTHAGTCQNCVAGKYFEGLGADTNTMCELCPEGSCSVNSGATTADTCGRKKVPDLHKLLKHGNSYCNTNLSCKSGTFFSPLLAMTRRQIVCCADEVNIRPHPGTPVLKCQNCVAGMFATTCGTTMHASKFSTNIGAIHENTCVQCGLGKYLPSTGNKAEANCLECGVGRWSNQPGAPSENTCTDCIAGKYSNTTLNVKENYCVKCDAGTYSETVRSVTSVNCIECITGKYSSAHGAQSSVTCIPCLSGYFSISTGADSSSHCQQCRAGTFSNYI